MKELEFIEIIKQTLSKSSYIGDDCAYLKDLAIVITHDSMVEDIHFSANFTSPYQLGYKAVMINLSDIFASGAIPKYITVSLSLPPKINGNFIKEFYRACDDLSKYFGFEVVGGDITGSDKIFVSISAIGTTTGRNISSRKNAKVGDYIITTGVHGSSAAGLCLLQKESLVDESLLKLIKSHLEPQPKHIFSNEMATKVCVEYTMMDTSDGLIDAVYKIAKSSNVLASLDFNKIPYDKQIEDVAKSSNIDYRDWIFYGGEDFQLVACLGEEDLKKIESEYYVIGRILPKVDSHDVQVDFNGKLLKINNLEETYNHFKENS